MSLFNCVCLRLSRRPVHAPVMKSIYHNLVRNNLHRYNLHTSAASMFKQQPQKVSKKRQADPSGYRKNPRNNAPHLKTVLRQFQMKVHPDFFGRHPELQQKNSENLQIFMGVLNSIKSGEKNELLEPQRHDLEFFVRTDKDDHFLRVPLKIDVRGGNSKHVLGRQLSTLFGHLGLPTEYHWGAEYWNIKLSQRTAEEEPEEEQD